MDHWFGWTVLGLVIGWFLGIISKQGRKNKLQTYQVWMTGMSKCVEVQAHDVDLDVDSDAPQTAYWNFFDSSEDQVTLHAFPYGKVEYIVSVPDAGDDKKAA